MRALATAPEKLSIVTQPEGLDLFLQRDAAAQALDCMQRGLIVADDCCQVTFSNRTAEKILHEKDGLSVGPNGLQADRSRDSANLRGLIRHAAGVEATPGDVTVFSAWRPSLKRSLLLRITPLQTPWPDAIDGVLRRAALFVHDPSAKARIDEHALSRLYGLTRAEALLLVRLLNGSTLEEASQVLRATMNTARTHLKHIFLKTDTNRQTQLVSLFLNSVIQVADLPLETGTIPNRAGCESQSGPATVNWR